MTRLAPDLVLYNGKIVTVDALFTVVEAIAIKGELIVATGGNSEIVALCDGDTRKIDLQGRTVIPGLIDTHFQFIDRSTAQYFGAHVDLPESINDVLDAVRLAASRIPEGRFITCNPGWYPFMLKEQRPPTREELDRVAPHHPVVLWGEFYYLNSLALQMSNITEQTPQPKYGWIGKDPQSGRLTGVLYGSAAKLAHAGHCTYSEDEKLEALRWSTKLMVQSGVTSLRDPKRTPEEIRTYQRLYLNGELPLRLSVQRYIPSQNEPKAVLDLLREQSLLTPVGDHWFRVDRAGYFYTDGGYHRMKISGKYHNLPLGIPDDGEDHFEPEQNLESLKEIVTGMARMGFTGSIMTGGDEALEMAIEALEAADQESGIRDKRWVLAHVIYPRPEQIRRLKPLGVIVTPMWHHHYYYPTQVYYHGESFAQGTEPYKDLLDAGVLVAQGTDVSTLPLNYFAGFYFTVTRNTRSWGKANPSQRLSREDALRTMTINGAFVTFEEKVKGSLEPGKLADLVVLSHDLMTEKEELLPKIRPLMTMVGGQIRYRDDEIFHD